jgi:hypothetical protein
MTAAEWNRRHPPGTRVRYYPQPGQPAYMETTTRGAAWTLSSGRALVALHGVRRAVPLAQVQPVAPSDPSAGAPAAHQPPGVLTPLNRCREHAR